MEETSNPSDLKFPPFRCQGMTYLSCITATAESKKGGSEAIQALEKVNTNLHKPFKELKGQVGDRGLEEILK